MYTLARQLLFELSPEASHELSIDLVGADGHLGLSRLLTPKPISLPVFVLGPKFPSPVGLTAGLDKSGDVIDGFGQPGFSFIKIGAVTPRSQPDNPKSRLFRLLQINAIISRMGFNNHGTGHLLVRVHTVKYRGVLEINIGKNFDTLVERTVNDYLIYLDKVYADASYIAANISSPNTPGLHSLQFGDSLEQLLEALRRRQGALALRYGQWVPLAIKIAPDMTDEETALVTTALIRAGMDAVIITNTTLGREGVEDMPHGDEVGDLPGTPVWGKSTRTVKVLTGELGGRLPIITASGITEGTHAAEKVATGASLVQVYSGLIYKGPALIREAVDTIAALPRRNRKGLLAGPLGLRPSLGWGVPQGDRCYPCCRLRVLELIEVL